MKQIETRTRRTVLKALGTAAVGGVALSGGATARADGGLKRELADVRAATAEYNDPENAIAAGYLSETKGVCGMGYHFPHEDLLEGIIAFQQGDPTVLAEYLGSLDRTEPPILVYGEDDDGNLMLGAVEYLTLDPSTDFFTETTEDEWDPFIGPVYALHAWVHAPNPEGVFHPVNPRPQFTRPEWCEEQGGHH